MSRTGNNHGNGDNTDIFSLGSRHGRSGGEHLIDGDRGVDGLWAALEAQEARITCEFREVRDTLVNLNLHVNRAREIDGVNRAQENI